MPRGLALTCITEKHSVKSSTVCEAASTQIGGTVCVLARAGSFIAAKYWTTGGSAACVSPGAVESGRWRLAFLLLLWGGTERATNATAWYWEACVVGGWRAWERAHKPRSANPDG